jgi:hypothetical protein
MTVYNAGTWTQTMVRESLYRFALDKGDISGTITRAVNEGHSFINTKYGITEVSFHSIADDGTTLFTLHTHKRTPALMADATDDMG